MKTILLLLALVLTPVLGCGSGYFYDNDGDCQSCHSDCKQCNWYGSSQCTQCRSRQVLDSPPGPSQCKPCHFSCQTCSKENNRTACLTCKTGYSQHTNTYSGNTKQYCLKNSCVDDKEYYDGNSCQSCDSSCSVCFQSGSSKCIACDNGYYQSGQTSCSSCDNACQTCSGSGNSNCITCSSGYYPQTATTCSACHVSCKTCTSPLIQACTDCKAAFSPTSLSFASSTYSVCRSSSCSTSKYSVNSNGGSCSNCNSACLTCFDSGSSSCVSCNDDYYMSALFTCSSCHFACSQCTSANNKDCSQCRIGYTHAPYSDASGSYGYCLGCPDGSYKANSAAICAPCHSNCEVCYGPNNNQCLTCKPGAYQAGSTTCIACSSPCGECVGSLNGNCTVCSTQIPALTIHTYGFDNKNYGFCTQCSDPTNYWDGSTCLLCDASCSRCYGSTPTKCMGCSDLYFESKFSQCTACTPPCSKCIGLLPGNCTECATTFSPTPYTYQSRSYIFCRKCSTNQYAIISPPGCGACNAACATCYGSTYTECLSCALQYYETVFTTCEPCSYGCARCTTQLNGNCSQCIAGFTSVNYPFGGSSYTFCIISSPSSCPTKQYKITAASGCVSCDPACEKCYGSTNAHCTVCADGYYQTDFTTCSPCFPGCRTCTDNNIDQCSSCMTGFQFKSYSYNLVTYGYCVEAACYASTKVYQTYVGAPTCLNCDQSCLKCYGNTYQNCLSCDDNFYETAKTTCSPCHTQCLRCNGNNNNECTKCIDQFYVEIVSSPGGYCRACQAPCVKCLGVDWDSCYTCTSGLYLEIKNNVVKSGQCKTCPTQCINCMNSYPNICLDCVPKYFLTKTNMTQLTGHCQPCHYSCAECSGALATHCSSCNSTSHRQIYQVSKCICGPWYMDDKQNNELCIDLECEWGSGETVNSTGYCSVVCGDGLVGDGEACDDHNLISQDGCSPFCTVEQYYLCVHGSKTQTSICFFATPIGLTMTKLIKDPYSNSFTAWYNTDIAQPFMDYLVFHPMVVLHFQHSSASFTYSSGVMVGQVSYEQNLHQVGSNIRSMTLQLSRLDPMFYNVPAINSYYNLESENNLAVNYYSQSVYDQVSVVGILATVIAFTGLVVCVIGMVRGKVVSVELVFTLQLSYFGLAQVTYSDPLFYLMKNLKYVNGFNLPTLFEKLIGPQPNQRPMNLVNMDVYPYLIENLNFMLVIPLAMGLAGLVMLLFQACRLQFTKSLGFRNRRKEILGEYLLPFMMFVCFPVSYYTGQMIRYLPSGMWMYINFSISGVFFLGFAGLIVHFIKNDHWHFGEFKSFFRQSKFCQMYFIIHMIQRAVLGLAFGALSNTNIPCYFLAAVAVPHAIVVLVLKPYSLKQQNIRSSINLFLAILTITIYSISGSTNPSQFGANFRVISPYLILLTTFSTICLSGVFIYRQLAIMVRVLIESRGNKKASEEEAIKKVQTALEQQLKKKLRNQNNLNVDVLKITRRKQPKKRKPKIKCISEELNNYNTDIIKERILNFQKYEAEWFAADEREDLDLPGDERTVAKIMEDHPDAI